VKEIPTKETVGLPSESILDGKVVTQIVGERNCL
jgi:hypothetical protein